MGVPRFRQYRMEPTAYCPQIRDTSCWLSHRLTLGILPLGHKYFDSSLYLYSWPRREAHTGFMFTEAFRPLVQVFPPPVCNSGFHCGRNSFTSACGNNLAINRYR